MALKNKSSSLFDLDLEPVNLPQVSTQEASTAPMTPQMPSDKLSAFAPVQKLTTTTVAIQIDPTDEKTNVNITGTKVGDCVSDTDDNGPLSPILLEHGNHRMSLLERPESPKSDSEIGTSTGNVVENVSWRWGEHLEPYQPEVPLSPNSAMNRVGLPSEEAEKANNHRFRSLSPPALPDRSSTKNNCSNSAVDKNSRGYSIFGTNHFGY